MGTIRHLSRRSARSTFAAWRTRRGAATVEFALVCPLIFLFFFTAIEFGRLQMAIHGLQAAAREGCRLAVSWNASQNDVEQVVNNRLTSFGLPNYKLTMSPSVFSSAAEWEPVTIQVETTYDEVSWLPVPKFAHGINLVGSCTLPKESD